ncbi:MAG TPA: hypothetical protein DDW84_00225 [Phycisphaerales bacterium]|nr:MAG: hypothetical protein A2Y13_01930 [Planctomycetes bacterium GWC2_45_44]HBG77263.1 hypothetical protein [Phycisphaerales bacterium]HBR19180.1 hypothetical protein [Phycisphaerales bacterium]
MIIALSSPEDPKRKPKAGKVRLRPIRPPFKSEEQFRKALEREIAIMRADIHNTARRWNDQTLLSQKYQELWTALDKWQRHFDSISQGRGKKLATDIFDNNKAKLIAGISDKMKMSVEVLFDDKKMQQVMDTATVEAAQLIKTIPGQYIGEVSRAVLTATKQQPLPAGRTLWQQIQFIGDTTKARAKFIARDQTSKANAAITEFQQTEAGIPAYEWRSSQDNRVVGKPGGKWPKASNIHGDHYHRDGKVFLWSKPPKDGHPGQAINCLLGDAIIDFSNGCNKLWRRKYSGIFTTLTTNEGGRLQATPNHPVLTNRGWLPINEVQEGDYLIKPIFEGGFVCKMNNNEFVASFKDIWDSCQIAGASSGRCSRLDFHGDGVENEVDTINVEGFLRRNGITLNAKSVNQFQFSATQNTPSMTSFLLSVLSYLPTSITSLFCNIFSAVNRSICHSHKHTLALASSRNVMLPQNTSDGRSLNTKFFSKSFFTHTLGIELDNLLFRKVIISVMGGAAFSGVRVNPPSAEALAEIVRITPHSDGNVFKCDSLSYQFCRVIKKSVCELSNRHIYNLQSNNGYYSANSYIVHNCRCIAIPILDRKKFLNKNSLSGL